ncbi:MAG TPA: ester cyclase [Chitinophagaceae bacterium]|nr:ester cyclase [Chitinophagaceae bacterium]
MDSVNLRNKKTVKRLLDNLANATPGTLDQCLSEAYHGNAEWRGSHPMNTATGLEAIKEKVWSPLINSFPDLERRDNIILGGNFKNNDLVGMMGHYAGTFTNDWFGIPATGGLIYLRYGEIHQVVNGKIAQSSVLVDVLDVIRQAGFWPFAPSLGSNEMWAAPITGDGWLLHETDRAQSEETLALTLAMHHSLGADPDNATDNGFKVEREALLNMSQKEYWHSKMMWYGPCGIGTSRGLPGFVDLHQRPFRLAFPERRSGGANHYCKIGDANYSLTAGWPSVIAKHAGSGWLGLPATNRMINMRVMDFYLIDEGLIRENWVPIDILDILLQMEVDVLARVRQQFKKPMQFE